MDQPTPELTAANPSTKVIEGSFLLVVFPDIHSSDLSSQFHDVSPYQILLASEFLRLYATRVIDRELENAANKLTIVREEQGRGKGPLLT